MSSNVKSLPTDATETLMILRVADVAVPEVQLAENGVHWPITGGTVKVPTATPLTSNRSSEGGVTMFGEALKAENCYVVFGVTATVCSQTVCCVSAPFTAIIKVPLPGEWSKKLPIPGWTKFGSVAIAYVVSAIISTVLNLYADVKL